MGDKSGSLKPFYLEEKKSGPRGIILETTASKWKQVCLQNMRKDDKWRPLLGIVWDCRAVSKGLVDGADEQANVTKATNVDAMLTYVAQYAPEALFRDITRRSNGLADVCKCIWEWANLKTTGTKHQVYAQLRRSYIHGSDNMSPTTSSTSSTMPRRTASCRQTVQ